jgi:CDGSH iron-sulfur domain-containing protein 3
LGFAKNHLANGVRSGYSILVIQHPNPFMNERVVFQKFPIVQKVEPGTYWWCSCGRSKSQPFCDGTHKGSSLAPQKVEVAEARTVAWCACKHAKSAPFCDGTHSKL